MTRPPVARAPFVVVGIGASAGGLSAIKAFFGSFTPSPVMAVVILQHMDMSGRELAGEILNKLSSNKCLEIEDGLVLRPNHIYFAPPQSLVTIKNDVFSVKLASERLQRLTLIDSLFTSLATDRPGSGLVGILLSGDGSDGCRGLQKISDNGGMTIVQAPETAEHPSMPQSAIASGIVDHVLKVSEMPAELKAYETYISRMWGDSNPVNLQEHIESVLPAICEVLFTATHHDFKHYKTSTLIRRIRRRMQVLQLNSVDAYIENLKQDPAEVDALFKELLINVTSFFRDPEAFEFLRDEILKRLMHGRPKDQKIRVWIAGCSTGEEAYSVAILIHEALSELTERPEVQIIATDIDEAALNIARKGSYPLSIAESVVPPRLHRYFMRKGDRFTIIKEIRELCLFSAHNLINDPPFSQVDLICCRNVMIYLGPHLQKKLIPVFHYALKPNGFLFLGNSESLMNHKELFKAVSVKHRLAQRKSTAVQVPGSYANLSNATYVSPYKNNTLPNDGDLHLITQRIVLDEFAPKYAVVNEDHQVMSVSAGIDEFLAPSEGNFQNNITKLVDTQLRVALRSALSEAKATKRRIDHDSSTIKTDAGFRRIGLTIQPMPQLGEESGLYMVVFRDLGILSERLSDDKESSHFQGFNLALVEQLETELASVREDLDKTVQDLEASNEELKSSNEELLSMNEELQSANEELESSKEEVQSSNEALQRSNSDLENLLASTEIATLFLDEELQIRNFTPAISEIYPLVKNDLGRAIRHFTHTAVAMPEYPDQRIFAKNPKVIEEDVTLLDGRRLLRRISPYRVHDGSISGIVVTFINVTQMREAEERYRLATDASKVGIWDWNLKNDTIHWLAHKSIMFGPASEGESPPESFESFKLAIHEEDRPRILASLKSAIDARAGFQEEYRVRYPDGQLRWVESRGQVFSTALGEPIRVLGTNLDRTEQKAAEDRLKASESRFRQLAEGMPQLSWISEADGRVTYLSQKWYAYTGLKPGTGLGTATWNSAIHPDDRDRVMQEWSKAVGGEASYRTEYRMRSSVGEFRWFLAWGTPIHDQEGRILQWFGTCTDIQDLKNAEIEREKQKQELAASEQEFRALANTMPNLAWIAHPDGAIYWYNERWYEYTGSNPEKMKGWGWKSVHEPGMLPSVEKKWRASIKSGEIFEMEFPLRSRTGEYRWFLTRSHPIKDTEGRVLRWFGTNTDVHEQLETRRALEQSEERYRLLTELSPQAIWTADAHGQISYVNQPWFDLTGASEGETLGQNWTQFVLDEDLERTKLAWQTALEAQQNLEVEVRILNRRTGDSRWVVVMASPMLDNKSQIVRWAGVAHEIDGRKQIEFQNEVLAEASTILTSSLDYRANLQKLLRLLVDYFGEWGFVQLHEADGTLKYSDYISKASDKLEALKHFADSIKGVHFSERNVLIRNGLEPNPLAQGSSGQASQNLAARCAVVAPLFARGINYGFMVIGSSLPDAEFSEREGNALRALCEKISIAVDNALLFEEAQIANVTKTTFLANVSHEIRTPLGAIMGFSELLHQSLPSGGVAHDYLERISRNARQLGRLIDELLDLSKIEADRLDIELIPFSLKALIEDATSTLAFKAHENGLAFRCLWNSPITRSVISDPNRIQQIIMNLLSNSIKFTPKGYIELSVALENQTENAALLLLRVTDTGVGLSEEEQKRLFKPFTQADNSVTRKFGGTGLGLALSKKLTNLLGGDLVIEYSAPGKGSSFLATLPVQFSKDEQFLKKEKTTREPIWAPDSLRGQRILIVDDSPDNQTIVMQYLDQVGAGYATADHGAIAVEMTKLENFDLILMDIQMPVMDGFAALTKLRQIGFKGPIVALTAHAMRGERERCLEAGFTEYLSKPLRRDSLFSKLHELLKVSEYR